MADLGALSPPRGTQTPAISYPPPPQPPILPDTSFPILVVSVLGILTTAMLLVSYYVIVVKCCLNWRRSDEIGRLSDLRTRQLLWRHDELSAACERRGLEEMMIRAIPIVRFGKPCTGTGGEKEGLLRDCAVCLSEFQDGEVLRRLPACSHHFHIDCIDIWLQSSVNCPVCRSEITGVESISPHSVVLEVGDDGGQLQTSPRKTEPQRSLQEKGRKLHQGASMGDECIDVGGRHRDEDFSVLPIRRSFSMDSSCYWQLSLSNQEIRAQGAAAAAPGSGGPSSPSAAAPEALFNRCP
ncbi:unnamed protein product [Spirodela intermedia]|uniref:RING-type E3 ubiquitin transferase n=1 Tax=Spirodela intermedia TaxID=51605 RepID=A0A7I8KZU6_SPIIN|nr:unnamed protein product [Spirodela intermedia]